MSSPPKSVRWAEQNEVYEHHSSPGSTSSTLSSSPGPATPLSFGSLEPDPSPLKLRQDLQVHQVLQFKRQLDFQFDVSIDPSNIPSSSSLSPEILKEPATEPSLKCLRIAHRHLPWELKVTPSDKTSSDAHVTVSDVLGALYAALHKPATDEECKQSGSEDVDKAFEQRCRKLMEHSVRDAELERQKGRRRVDFLHSKLMFSGFTVENGKLRLHVH